MKKASKIFLVSIKKGRWCAILLLCLFNSNCFSQEVIPFIQQQFNAYKNNNYQEKVFLHTDKTVYSTGEILWFKAYVTNAVTNKFSMLSKICYVEIVGADRKILMQAKVSIDSGKGNGSFLITSSIRTGSYYIRAYTNWMRNFDSQFYFEENIDIINPNKKGLSVSADSALAANIQFLPEGGNLVYGLPNNVAFKLTDAYGRGLAGKGFILTDKNDTVSHFETAVFGMGTFSFNPVRRIKYYAIIKAGEQVFTKELPVIFDKGWILHVQDDGNTLTVNVTCNIESERNVFLFLQDHDSIQLVKMLPLTNGSAAISINKSDLDAGISQLTVFNEERQAVCERLLFKKPISDCQLKLENIHASYEQRKKVDLDISAVTNGMPINANMSVAVYLADSLQPELKLNILNYLWLSSELKGEIESPEYYFENSGAEVVKATDNLMLTQGWRRFKWEDVLKNTKPSFSFLPEYEGHIITGKISPKITGIGDTGVSVFLSVPGKNFKFVNTYSLNGGLLRFNVGKFYGSRELVIQANEADSNYRILIDNSFSEQFNDRREEPRHYMPLMANDMLLRSIGAQSRVIFNGDLADSFTLPVAYDTTAFYGVPFKQYFLDDYTRFPTMEEVMREYVKEVHVRKKDKNFHFEVFNEPYITYFDNEPLVLFDGVPVFNVNKIIDMDPLKIQKVDITASKFFQGKLEYDGIVSYSSYNGDLESYQLDPNSLVVEYDGLQLQRQFYSPQYDSDQKALSRNPDYRNVLYWLPDLDIKKSKQHISFYTSDIPGKYIIVAQGISDAGGGCFATTSFSVSSK
jgi:hypothetical protein